MSLHFNSRQSRAASDHLLGVDQISCLQWVRSIPISRITGATSRLTWLRGQRKASPALAPQTGLRGVVSMSTDILLLLGRKLYATCSKSLNLTLILNFTLFTLLHLFYRLSSAFILSARMHVHDSANLLLFLRLAPKKYRK